MSSFLEAVSQRARDAAAPAAPLVEPALDPCTRLLAPRKAAEAAASSQEDMTLLPAGKRRFATCPPQVFQTSTGCRLVYQLSRGSKTPVVVLGGGQTGRSEACAGFGAESAFLDHTVLIFDRRNTGAADVDYRGVGFEPHESSENHVQRDDLIELIEGLHLAPCILVGYSSGARIFGLAATKRPDLVRAAVLCILTGGHRAAKALGHQYYGRYAKLAQKGGMEEVLETPFYAQRAELNRSSAARLGGMDASAFVSAMKASEKLYLQTKDEPALALRATDLASLHMPVLCVHYFPSEEADGMHTARVTRAVAAAVGQGTEAVVSAQVHVWWSAVVAFVERHSTLAAPEELEPSADLALEDDAVMF